MSKRSNVEDADQKDGIQVNTPVNNDNAEDVKRVKLTSGSRAKNVIPLVPKKGIQIKLSSQKESQSVLKTPSKSVASVFGDDSDDEPEEMPPEARMRMRNIGRDTPTSAGPNSYGKTKQGFCNVKKVFEKNLKEAAFELSDDKTIKK